MPFDVLEGIRREDVEKLLRDLNRSSRFRESSWLEKRHKFEDEACFQEIGDKWFGLRGSD